MIIAKSKMSVQPGTGDMIKFWSVNFGSHRLGGALFNHIGHRERRAYNKVIEVICNLAPTVSVEAKTRRSLMRKHQNAKGVK